MSCPPAISTELFPLRSPKLYPRDSIVKALVHSLEQSGLSIRNGDIVAVASKAISMSEGRIINLENIKARERAIRLARNHRMIPEFVQVVIDEADRIYGGVEGALLTLKDGFATANAGVDRKNAPTNSVVLWPRNTKKSANLLRNGLQRRTGKKVGVIVVDSRVTPLRLGTIGLSLASVGFKAVEDFRGKPDLNNRNIQMTYQSLGDGIAAAAQLLMGEARERVPFVIVRGAPVEFEDATGPNEKMSVEDCLYMSQVSG